MLSRAAPVFYGDLRSHERVIVMFSVHWRIMMYFLSWMTGPWSFCFCICLQVPLPFSTFIGFCKRHRQNVNNSCSFNSNSEGHQPGESDTEQGCSSFVDAAPQQIYLAQVSTLEFYDRWYVCIYFFRNCFFSFI